MSTPTKPVTIADVIEEARAPSPDREENWREEGIRARVLAALGRPPELIRVSVMPLWGDKFRVNVWATGSNGSTIPDSYFVTADQDGTILSAEPPIQKRY